MNSNGPVKVNHGFSWVNNVAVNRNDCRRQMGLGDKLDGNITSSEAPNVAATQKGKSNITRAGILSQAPGYSMPKDTQQSFLAHYERKGKATPGPDEHYH